MARARPASGGVRALDPEAFIFLHGSAPARSSRPHTRWSRVVSAGGVPYREPENLRHSWASILRARGAPVPYVQKAGAGGARWIPADGQHRSPVRG